MGKPQDCGKSVWKLSVFGLEMCSLSIYLKYRRVLQISCFWTHAVVVLSVDVRFSTVSVSGASPVSLFCKGNVIMTIIMRG